MVYLNILAFRDLWVNKISVQCTLYTFPLDLKN